MTALTKTSLDRLWRYALWLAILTIVYNLAEGLVSVYFGGHDEALTLFGFGLDSFIEVLSGAGILAMVLRIRQDADSGHGPNGKNPLGHSPNAQNALGHSPNGKNPFERSALRITGGSFYLLAAGLGLTALYNLWSGHRPTTSLPGVVIALISIACMWLLVAAKRRVGSALGSAPILADANCSLVCIYMSLVLLAASLVYQLTGVGFVDSLGALGLIYFSINEGREAFEKAARVGDDGDE